MYEHLQELLEEKHVSKYALAKAARISTSDIYSIFKGSKPLYPNWKRRICESLELDEREAFPELNQSK